MVELIQNIEFLENSKATSSPSSKKDDRDSRSGYVHYMQHFLKIWIESSSVVLYPTFHSKDALI